MGDLLIIVPTRGRPESVPRLIEAWEQTHAFECATLMFAIDKDDPELDGYRSALGAAPVLVQVLDEWLPMVRKLDAVARTMAATYPCIGFAGDDHLPRTEHWAAMYLAGLDRLGTGIVYGDDGFQGEKLPTQWAMTSDIVQALGRMVPAPVEHLYCDNAILTLGRAAKCISYVPQVRIEHMHPAAGKAETDEGYRRVNRPEQYRRDLDAFLRWQEDDLAAQAATIRATREVKLRG